MKAALKIITVLYGLFWLIFGLNNFLHLFPVSAPSQAGADFMQALEDTNYVLPLVYAMQVIAGLMLLAYRFVPLALLLLAPVIANILLYDIFLNPSGLVIGGVIGALDAVVLFDHRQKIYSVFKTLEEETDP